KDVPTQQRAAAKSKLPACPRRPVSFHYGTKSVFSQERVWQPEVETANLLEKEETIQGLPHSYRNRRTKAEAWRRNQGNGTAALLFIVSAPRTCCGRPSRP